MINLLLLIIYLAFISLGLPDSLIGASWPVSHLFFKVDIALVSTISLMTAGSTVLSSFFASRFIQKFRTEDILWVSILLTIIGLVGYGVSTSYWHLLLFAIPYGLGGGNIDAVLNHYVAKHFESRHMSWLHSFWGIGASTGPLIMALFLQSGTFWQGPFFVVAFIQSCLLITILLTKKVWRLSDPKNEEDFMESSHVSTLTAFKSLRVKDAMASFFVYVAMEGIVAVWLASYLVEKYHLLASQGAQMVSVFFFSLTLGRLLDGFLSLKFSNIYRLRYGQLIGLFGIIILIYFSSTFLLFVSFALMGIGFAPQYPIMMHETPNRFGKQLSASVISLQISSAYIGFMAMNVLSGFWVKSYGLDFIPIFMVSMMLLLMFFTQRIEVMVQKRNS